MTDITIFFIAVLVLAGIILLMCTAIGMLTKAVRHLGEQIAQRETTERATDDSAPTGR